jgi:mannitol PTS system EIICBA or EIICB component
MSDVAVKTATGRARVQKFGRFMSGMIMPNIGAFIAWGFITTLFIPTGWLPNERLAGLVGPMITYLLPLLIGSPAGRWWPVSEAAWLGPSPPWGSLSGRIFPCS